MTSRWLHAGVYLAIATFGYQASLRAETPDAIAAVSTAVEAPLKDEIPHLTVPASNSRVTDTVRAVARAKAGTVNIHSEKRGETSATLFPASRDRKVGMGTGIIIDSRGYIVTNYHVVADVDSLRVTLYDGSSYDARVISYDKKHDLAVIKINATRPLDVIPIGTSSDLMLGEDVLAIGNAFGYEHTVTRGIISSLSRDVEVNEEQSYENLIQIDAAINPGNSGGPLLNREGDVIGINVAIRAGAQKIGFAIPIDDARQIVAKLLNVQRLDQMFHGVVGKDFKRGAERKMIISSVAPGSPASEAGLRPGDVVTQVDGLEIVDSADFERAMLHQSPGKKLDVVVKRGGMERSLALGVVPLEIGRQTIRSQSPVATTPPPTVDMRDRAWSVFGLKLAPLQNPEIILAGTDYNGGMLVTAVRPSSPAERNGIRAGDVLVGLHQWETITADNVNFVLKHPQFNTFNPLKFFIFRDGETLYGLFQLNPAK